MWRYGIGDTNTAFISTGIIGKPPLWDGVFFCADKTKLFFQAVVLIWCSFFLAGEAEDRRAVGLWKCGPAEKDPDHQWRPSGYAAVPHRRLPGRDTGRRHQFKHGPPVHLGLLFRHHFRVCSRSWWLIIIADRGRVSNWVFFFLKIF